MKDGRLAQALLRAGDILEATAARAQGFAALQKVLAITPAGLSRLLKAMQDADLLREAGEGYEPGPRARSLAERLGGGTDLAVLAPPAMRLLAEAMGESAACFVPTDDGIRCLAKHELAERFHYLAVGGVNRGLDRHAACRLRAAWWDEATARARHADLGSGTDVEAWLADGRRLREAGFLLTPSDDQPGIARAAAAITTAGDDLHGIVVVTGIAAGWNGQRAATILAAVRRCAEDLRG